MRRNMLSLQFFITYHVRPKLYRQAQVYIDHDHLRFGVPDQHENHVKIPLFESLGMGVTALEWKSPLWRLESEDVGGGMSEQPLSSLVACMLSKMPLRVRVA